MEAPLRFQHFEVLTKPDGLPHVLGKGAMGVTYKAFDTNLHKIVVIKVISPRFLSDPTARQRFLNEAKAMAQIKHPHVADVFHFGETPTGVFYAMEYCHGPALEEYVRQRGSLKIGDALLLCKQVAGALQAIEQAALIHRDVKPSNLILTQDVQGTAQLKLIDFGLARPGTPDEHDPNLTQGGFVGTPNYASPEQLLEQEGLDIRTDIYSLGGTLWFLLTGEPIFRGSHVEVMFHHVNSPPPFERLPHLPESALAILKRMLSKAVDDRFATAGDLWNAIDDCLRQENLAEPGSAPKLPNLDVREPSHGGILGRSNYEILGEGGQIRDGVLFQARDVLYGRLVALRYLKREIAGNSAMVRKLRAEAARLKSLPHANLISVLGFQEDEDGVKIVQEWVSGPALLDLLKARDHLPLNELAPMLAQLAAGLDHAIRHEMGSVETQVHQILIQVPEAPTEGSNRTWHGLLRRPLAEWGDFTVKLNPLGASLDWREEKGGVGRKIFREFLALAHRLLGGVFGSQTQAHDQYATVPHLRAEGNEILERYLFESMPSSGTPCRQALAELLAAERVTYELPAAEAPAPAAPPVPADETVVSSVVKPASWSVPASSTGESGAASTEEYHAKRLELDRKRQALQAEEAQLEHQQRLEAERQVVAQERQLLEQQREDLRRREQERAQAADEERRRLEAERERLEKHAADLDQKRKEQDRLAQELRLRSQLEFQKLQEDRSKLEDEWGKRREATQELLRQKEEEFLLREQEGLRRLQEQRQEVERSHQELAARRQELEERTSLDQEALRRRQQELESQLAQRDQDLLTARTELQTTAAALEERRRAIAEEKRQLETATAAERESREAALNQRAQDLEREWQELEKSKEQARAEMVQALDRERRKLVEERNALASQMAEAEQTSPELENLRRRQQELESQLAQRDQDLLTARRELQTSSEALEERRKAIEEEKRQLETATAAERETREAALNQRAQDLEREWQELEKSKEQARAEIGQALEQERRKLVEERNTLAQRATQLAGQSEDARAALLVLDRERTELTERRAELERQDARLRESLEAEKTRLLAEDQARRAREEQEHEARLVDRAREFARLEEAQMARLANLEREVLEAENKLSQERETVFTQERRHEAAVREASQEDEAVQERILMAQARLDEERALIDRKILQLHQGQKTRLITIAAGVVLAVIGAGVTGWLVKARLLDPRDMPYQKAWNSFQQERDRARTAKDWSKLLGWCVSTNWAFTNPDGFQDPVRRAQYEDFYRDKHAVVRKDAQESIDALVEIASKGPLPREVDRKSLLINLNVTKDWEISSKRDLLRALLILDDTNPSNHAACLEAYRNAVTADPSLMLPLQGRLTNAAEAAWDDFREDWNVDGAAQLLQAIDELSEPSRVAAPRLTLLKEAILAEKLREDGQKAEALEAVVAAGRTKPEWFADLAPARERIVNDLATQPFATLQSGLRTLQREAIKTPAWSQEFSASILTLATAAAARPEVNPSDALTLLLDVNREFPSLSAALAPSVTDVLERIPAAATDQVLALQNLLVAAGEAWKMPLPFMRLAAAIESKLRADPSLAGTLRQTLFDFYRRADGFGDADARAEVGGFYVGAGVNDQSADDIKKGLDLLAAAEKAGSIRAPQILGEFYFSGMGVPADADQAVSWARKALEAGHPDSRLLLGKSLLRKAELTKDAALYQESSQILQQTVDTHLDAYNFLYVAMWNETVQQPAEAAKMLQAGAAKGVVGCEYFLGLWYANGNPPIEQNLSLAREWITKAAKDGHPEARNWCQQQGVKWE